MRWIALEQAQPLLVAALTRRIVDPGVVLVGSVRTDGSPRISPVEPLVWRGDLWLSMLWHSTKARDLLRDDRILVHSIVTSRDGAEGEVKLRGRARDVTDDGTQAGYADEVSRSLGWSPTPGRFHLFAIDIEDVTVIRYVEATGDQFTARWPAGREFVRRGTSATSLGEPEPWSELLRDH